MEPQGRQNQIVQVMAEAIATAYLRVKARQHEVSRALYLIAIELDASGSIGAATRRAGRAEMLLTAGDRCLPDAPLVARVLLAAVFGAVLAFYEQDTPPRIGGDVEQEFVSTCRAYLAAAGRTG